jgi:hypothetical protein
VRLDEIGRRQRFAAGELQPQDPQHAPSARDIDAFGIGI